VADPVGVLGRHQAPDRLYLRIKILYYLYEVVSLEVITITIILIENKASNILPIKVS
jgi:hypothetical protein